jgi:exopolysaccharide biosynthesis polyprenyl glycosylphosphotransferase
MFHSQREILRIRSAVFEAAITAMAFALAYVLRQQVTELRLFYLERAPMLGMLTTALAIWLATGFSMGLYQSPERMDAGLAARQTLRQTLLSTASLLVILYLVRLSDVSRTFMLLFVAINTLLLFVWRLAEPALNRTATRSGNRASVRRSYIVIGAGEDAATVARLIEDGGPQVLAYIRDNPASALDPAVLEAVQAGRSRLAEPGELAGMLRDCVVEQVIFAINRPDVSRMEELFLVCEQEGVRVGMVVNLFPGMSSAVSLDRIHHLPLLTFSRTPDNHYLLLIKRVFDIAVAGTMAAVFAPVALIVMVAIRLTSRGPVFFTQERMGLNGRSFRLFKFRSMYQDAEARRAHVESLNEMDGPVFKCANDPRITPVGRYLRRFSIDEWPQLLNVIKGDMSLVGPRPPLPDEVRQYTQWQRRRLRMKPGLTCLWVLEGRNKLDFHSWMTLDLNYIDEWSLGLDFRILLQSIPHVLSGKGM